jgi:hypothetical protein
MDDSGTLGWARGGLVCRGVEGCGGVGIVSGGFEGVVGLEWWGFGGEYAV